MGRYSTSVYSWPLCVNGDYVLTTTEEAFWLAALVFDDPELVAKIESMRRRARSAFYADKIKDHKNYNMMMIHAFRSQLYRECLEEIDRLKKEVK